uniref:Uncharacterized protein n=1 Tax=Panagrolaimus superbus TaxID=310955 RepID=A0A914Y3B9_9BILA
MPPNDPAFCETVKTLIETEKNLQDMMKVVNVVVDRQLEAYDAVNTLAVELPKKRQEGKQMNGKQRVKFVDEIEDGEEADDGTYDVEKNSEEDESNMAFSGAPSEKENKKTAAVPPPVLFMREMPISPVLVSTANNSIFSSNMGKAKDNNDIVMEEIEEVEPDASVKKKKRRQTDINGSDQPSSSKPNGLRHTLNPSDINQLGFHTESDHVIAVMDHFRLKESETPKFIEHVYKANKKIYSFKNKEAPTVTFFGKEKIDKDDNYDYCLGIYNRETQEVEYKSISLLRFEGIPNIDPELLTEKDIKERVNYAADYSIKQEHFEKKNKMLEATLRRQINDDTLTTLSKSTFESKNAVAKTEDGDSKAFATAESSVLPPANRTATVPADIYPLSLFYTEFILQSFGKISQDFFKENNVMAKLTALGVPKLIAEVASKVMNDQKDEIQCFLVLQLIIMSIFVQQMAANKRSLQASEFDNFPSAIFHHIRDEYFSENFKTNSRWGYTQMERDRLVAWFLCLFLVLNNFRVAITPLASQLHLSEQKSGKTLSALGCVVSSATVDESQRYDTMRMARLLEPPSDKRLRKRRRGGA